MTSPTSCPSSLLYMKSSKCCGLWEFPRYVSFNFLPSLTFPLWELLISEREDEKGEKIRPTFVQWRIMSMKVSITTHLFFLFHLSSFPSFRTMVSNCTICKKLSRDSHEIEFSSIYYWPLRNSRGPFFFPSHTTKSVRCSGEQWVFSPFSSSPLPLLPSPHKQSHSRK